MKNNTKFRRPFRIGLKAHANGITLVEVILALGVLAILLACAAKPLERMSARIDVDVAREHVVHTLETAQRTAISANRPVRVSLSEDSTHKRLVAGFSQSRGALDFYHLPNYDLPDQVTVSISEGMASIEYLPIGRVSTTGVITLSSRLHPEYVVNIRIVNLAGHLEVDDGLMQKLDRMKAESTSL